MAGIILAFGSSFACLQSWDSRWIIQWCFAHDLIHHSQPQLLVAW
jgi:hypothetical protein